MESEGNRKDTEIKSKVWKGSAPFDIWFRFEQHLPIDSTPNGVLTALKPSKIVLREGRIKSPEIPTAKVIATTRNPTYNLRRLFWLLRPKLPKKPSSPKPSTSRQSPECNLSSEIANILALQPPQVNAYQESNVCESGIILHGIT
ncbi:hypothetical protein ACTXT7_003792 [Hymenolepis weldensis]